MCECRTESLLEFRQPGDLSEISDWWSSRKLLRHLHDEQVEVVVCATVPQARLLTFLKRRGETNVRIVVVHSDHGPYFGWGDMRHIDLIAVADPESCDAFLKRGVPAEKLCCYGIPTASHPGYFAPLEARPEVTVYLAAGGFGWGGIHRPVEQLAGLSGLKMKVVCGENPDAVRRVRAIAAKHPGQIEVHGKLSDPLPLMAECHLYIGAPGGQTMSEASNLGLGAVIPWMGKNGNSAYFKKHGAAHVIPFEELRVVVQKLLEDRDQLMSLRMNARRIARPAASEQTARRILEVLP